MKFSRFILALGAFFVLVAGVSACGGGVPGDSVADMAGNPITTQAYNHWMFVAAKGNSSQTPGAPVIVPSDPPDFKKCIAQVRKQIPTLTKTSDKALRNDCNQLFTSLSGQVMDFLIKTYWYQAEATKQHLTVTDAQVQTALTSAKKQQFPTDAAFQTFLTQSGQTLGDIVYRVRVNQVLRKLLAKHNTTVTPEQVQAYYQAHLSQFGSPETRDLRIVLTKTSKQASAAKAALAGGQSWKAVAKKYSTDPTTKNNSGQLLGVGKGQQDAALDSAAFSAPVNKVLGPVHGAFGFYVFEVTKIRPSTQQTLAQATALIQQTLRTQAQTAAQTAIDTQAKKDWQHKTQCRAQFAVSDCNGYKPPKGSTTLLPQTSSPPATTG